MQGWATNEDMMTNPQVFVGIDVSKKTVTPCLPTRGTVRRPHDEAGFAQVLERLRTVSPALVVLEAPRGE